MFARPLRIRRAADDLLLSPRVIIHPLTGRVIRVPRAIRYHDDLIPWARVPREWLPILPWEMAITSVQNGATNSDTGSGTTLAATFGSNVSAGSLVVIGTLITTNISVSGISDGTTAGTSGVAKLYVGGVDGAFELWYYANHAGSKTVFTATWASAETFRWVGASEWAGVATSSPLVGTPASNGASGNGTAATTGNLSPAVSDNGSLYVGHGRVNDDPPTFADSFAYVPGTSRDGNTFEFLGYRIQPTAGDLAMAWTQTSGHWVAQAASFKPQTGGGGAISPGSYYTYYRNTVAEVA